jgi:hypothetical protein
MVRDYAGGRKMRSRGRTKYQDSKAISTGDSFEKKRMIAMWGVLLRDPLLLPFWYAFGGATRLSESDREKAKAEIVAATVTAYVELDADFFHRAAKIIQGISDINKGNIADSADPNLRALIEAYYLCQYMNNGEFPTREDVFGCALELYCDFTQEPSNRSKYCKQLGLKFSRSQNVRGRSRHAS